MKNKRLFLGYAIMLGFSLVGVLICMAALPARAMTVTPKWLQTNTDGFGDPLNQQIASLEVFNDYLYAGVWHFSPPEGSSAQIWRSSTGESWEKVDERDFSAAADMISFKNAIYAGSWDGKIWWSSDGISWEDVISDGFGDPHNGIAHFEVYNDTLYASTWNVDGTQIWRTSDGQDWDQFVEAGYHDPDNGGAIASAVFHDLLYWGVLNIPDGGEIWRSDGITTTVVISQGFGIPDNQAVSSLAVFSDNLYAGVLNNYGIQVWRSPDGLEWTQVLDGLGNPPNSEINGLEVYQGKLYLVAQCDETGMQVWRTSNGIDWEQVGFAGFGDVNNKWSYWDNAITEFKDKLYVATINFVSGGEVWRTGVGIYQSLLPCAFSACLSTYFDDFSDPSSGWPQGEDYAYINGEYHILVKTASWGIGTLKNFIGKDFSIEVDTRPGSHLSGAVGLVFSYSLSGHYIFEINNDSYSLWRVGPGEWTALIGWTPSSAILPGFQTNHLKVVRNRDEITLYANGQLLAQVSDNAFHGAGLGMVSFAYEDNFVGVFDNLKVFPGCLENNAASSINSPDLSIWSTPEEAEIAPEKP